MWWVTVALHLSTGWLLLPPRPKSSWPSYGGPRGTFGTAAGQMCSSGSCSSCTWASMRRDWRRTCPTGWTTRGPAIRVASTIMTRTLPLDPETEGHTVTEPTSTTTTTNSTCCLTPSLKTQDEPLSSFTTSHPLSISPSYSVQLLFFLCRQFTVR